MASLSRNTPGTSSCVKSESRGVSNLLEISRARCFCVRSLFCVFRSRIRMLTLTNQVVLLEIGNQRLMGTRYIQRGHLQKNKIPEWALCHMNRRERV